MYADYTNTLAACSWKRRRAIIRRRLAERRKEKWLLRAEQWLVLGLMGFLGATTIILAGAWCYAVATRLGA